MNIDIRKTYIVTDTVSLKKKSEYAKIDINERT